MLLSWSRMTRLTASRMARKMRALIGWSWPEASGRLAVRVTCASSLRSHRSFTTQPAPRMVMAPRKNKIVSQSPVFRLGAARQMDQRPGRNNSQAPIGRSNRARMA